MNGKAVYVMTGKTCSTSFSLSALPPRSHSGDFHSKHTNAKLCMRSVHVVPRRHCNQWNRWFCLLELCALNRQFFKSLHNELERRKFTLNLFLSIEFLMENIFFGVHRKWDCVMHRLQLVKENQ